MEQSTEDVDPHNPFRVKWMDIVKKKQINVGKTPSAKEERGSKQKVFDEVFADWKKADKQSAKKDVKTNSTHFRSVWKGAVTKKERR